MKTGVFTYDEKTATDLVGEYSVYLADSVPGDELASIMNSGTAKLMDDGCEQVVFIGRGCTAQKDMVTDHAEQLGKHLYPLITCGRILHEAEHWLDYREMGPARRLNLFNAGGSIIQNPSVLTSGYGISVANFGMNRAAIDRLNRFTRMYYEHPGPFPVTESRRPYGYGKVLSLCAWCSRITMFMLPTGRLNAVVHETGECNPYSENGCDADASSAELNDMNKKMAKKPLDLDFFDSVHDR